MLFNVHTHVAQPNGIYSPFDLTQIESGFDFISLGIHPWKLAEINLTETFILLESLLDKHKSKLLAIGECGLDRTIETSLTIQLDVFKKHIELSEKLKLPLIIHCVKTFEELIKLKKEFKPTQPWIIHDFRKNDTLANQLVNHGFYLSLSPSIFKVKSEVLAAYPTKNILFETDESTIDIQEVFRFFAEVKNLDKKNLRHDINNNIYNIFKINNEN